MLFNVRLGNPAPHRTTRHPETDELIVTPLEPLPNGEERVTEVSGELWEKPEDLDPQHPTNWLTPEEVLAREIQSFWYQHGSEPPSWVEADTPALQSYLAMRLGCADGRPAAAAPTPAPGSSSAQEITPADVAAVPPSVLPTPDSGPQV